MDLNVQVLFKKCLSKRCWVLGPVTVVNVVASVTHKPTVAIVVTVTPKYGAMAAHG